MEFVDDSTPINPWKLSTRAPWDKRRQKCGPKAEAGTSSHGPSEWSIKTGGDPFGMMVFVDISE